MVLPDSDRVTRVPPYSGTDQTLSIFAYGTITLYGEPFQTLLLTFRVERSALQPPRASPWVWTIPSSLAATIGISIDFYSSGYLDVSVLRVSFAWLCIHHTIRPKPWVSPFGNVRIKAC